MLRTKLSCFYYLSYDRLWILFDFAREEGLYNCIVGVNFRKVTVRPAGKPERSQMSLLLFFISLLLDKPLFYFVGIISESY